MNKKIIIYFTLSIAFALGILALVLDIGNYFQDRSKKFVLSQLPYSYDALEPYIDTETMKIHHTKHHQAYTDNLNKTLENYPELLNKSIEEILSNLDKLPEQIKIDVINFGGGYYNHNFFWKIMSPKGGGEPQGELLAEINKDFGSFEKFKGQFNANAKKLFGSGWTWLCLNKDKNLEIINTQNQDSPISLGYKPLLCLDVWEHAYYLKYQNKRVDYIDAWWFVVNWPQVAENYKKALI